MPSAKPPLPRLQKDHPSAKGLVGAWLFYESAGSTVYDLSGNGNDGTLVNTPTWSAGRYGGQLLLASASSQYVNLGNPTALQLTNDISVFCAYQLTSGGGQLVAKDKDSGGRAYTLEVFSGSAVRFYINGGGGNDIVTDGRAPVAGDRRTILGTYRKRDKRLRIYTEGTLRQQKTADTSGIPSATANVLIGRREYSGFEEPFNGAIPFVYIWNREVDSGEAKRLHAFPFEMFEEPDPLEEWGYFIPTTARRAFRTLLGVGI